MIDLSMILDAKVLLFALALSVVILTLIEAFIKPAFVKFKLDPWWLLYVGLVIGGAVSWAAGLNAFTIFQGNVVWVGKLMTAALCGGGPSIIYNLMDKGQPARLPEKIT